MLRLKKRPSKLPSRSAINPVTPPSRQRSPGHRGADVKDTVAEMAAKAHEISLEAGANGSRYEGCHQCRCRTQ